MSIKYDDNRCGYFLIKPKIGRNVKHVAKKLVGLKNVREVVVTEGEYGFIVRASVCPERKLMELKGRIAKAVGGYSRIAVCYSEYVRL